MVSGQVFPLVASSLAKISSWPRTARKSRSRKRILSREIMPGTPAIRHVKIPFFPRSIIFVFHKSKDLTLYWFVLHSVSIVNTEGCFLCAIRENCIYQEILPFIIIIRVSLHGPRYRVKRRPR